MAERWDSRLRRFAGAGARSRNPGATGISINMAERVGFESTHCSETKEFCGAARPSTELKRKERKTYCPLNALWKNSERKDWAQSGSCSRTREPSTPTPPQKSSARFSSRPKISIKGRSTASSIKHCNSTLGGETCSGFYFSFNSFLSFLHIFGWISKG